MKKIITLCVFAFALLLNTQISFAQDASSMTNFKQEIKTVSAALNLNDDQIQALSKAYIAREKTYQAKKVTNKAQFEQKFLATIERILTKAQFDKYKSMKN